MATPRSRWDVTLPAVFELSEQFKNLHYRFFGTLIYSNFCKKKKEQILINKIKTIELRSDRSTSRVSTPVCVLHLSPVSIFSRNNLSRTL